MLIDAAAPDDRRMAKQIQPLFPNIGVFATNAG